MRVTSSQTHREIREHGSSQADSAMGKCGVVLASMDASGFRDALTHAAGLCLADTE
jgi:hypothetical protein